MAKNDPIPVYLVGLETERFVAEFPPRHDEDGVQVNSGQNSVGQEMPDPVPTAPPVGFMQTPDLKDIIRDMLRDEQFKRAAAEAGVDTFEEGEDFDIEDDPLDPETEYEAEFDPEWMKVKEAYAARLRGPEAWAEFCRKEGLTLDGKKFIRNDPRKEADTDGSSNIDEGRVADRDGGSRRVDPVGKGKSGKKQDADDGRGVSEADRGSARSDE